MTISVGDTVGAETVSEAPVGISVGMAVGGTAVAALPQAAVTASRTAATAKIRWRVMVDGLAGR